MGDLPKLELQRLQMLAVLPWPSLRGTLQSDGAPGGEAQRWWHVLCDHPSNPQQVSGNRFG